MLVDKNLDYPLTFNIVRSELEENFKKSDKMIFFITN